MVGNVAVKNSAYRSYLIDYNMNPTLSESAKSDVGLADVEIGMKKGKLDNRNL